MARTFENPFQVSNELPVGVTPTEQFRGSLAGRVKNHQHAGALTRGVVHTFVFH
jgi:hypothetical protein